MGDSVRTARERLHGEEASGGVAETSGWASVLLMLGRLLLPWLVDPTERPRTKLHHAP